MWGVLAVSHVRCFSCQPCEVFNLSTMWGVLAVSHVRCFSCQINSLMIYLICVDFSKWLISTFNLRIITLWHHSGLFTAAKYNWKKDRMKKHYNMSKVMLIISSLFTSNPDSIKSNLLSELSCIYQLLHTLKLSRCTCVIHHIIWLSIWLYSRYKITQCKLWLSAQMYVLSRNQVMNNNILRHSYMHHISYT